MTLEKDIRRQYEERSGKAELYNSVYSRCAEEERESECKALVNFFLKDVKNKTVLEIGAGQGGNVPLLNACGFINANIYLNELLPERAAAIRKNRNDVHLYEGNALIIDFKEKYDCIFQSTVFTSLLKDSDRKILAEKMWNLLKPGGMILWYDFIYNNPNNPSVRKVSVKEMKRLFPMASLTKIKKVTLAPPVGRRIGKLYRLFNLPFLRSHVLAALVKPSV